MPTGVPSELFDDDYLYFYSDVLGSQRSDADAALISELLSLGPGMRVELRGDGGAPFAPDARRLIAIAQRPGPGVARERSEVSLREVDAANVRAVCELELAPGQRTYVAPAAYTLAEGQHEAGAWVRAIYNGDEVVGLLALVDHVRSLPGATELGTSCVPGPVSPKSFYLGLGFEPTGEVSHGEEVLTLRL